MGQHWYRKDEVTGGVEACHFMGKDGRATTLREGRKYKLTPSVTSIGGVKYRFGLEQWKIETAVRYALTQPDGRDVKEVVKEAFEELDKQAQDGTDIHAILEAWATGEPFDQKYIHMCVEVYDLIMENTGLDIDDFEVETRFCDTVHGYAGMCDLHNEHWIIDYKSKDTVDEKTKGWPEQAEQLAAYAHGLGYPNARLANIFISRADPTQLVWYEHKDPLEAWERFRHTLMLWQVENKYGPYYETLHKL